MRRLNVAPATLTRPAPKTSAMPKFYTPNMAQPAVNTLRPPRARTIILWSVYLISFALLAWFFIDGYSYYTAPYADRPHHPQYSLFRPAGTYGLSYGIAGAAMMVLMLVYTLRKRTKWLGRAVQSRYLLDFHIYMGIIGPLLIVLHSSFRVHGLIAVAFWSMVAVSLSGFFGRYLYLQIPRNIAGKELTLSEIEMANAEMASSLKARFNIDDDQIRRIEALFESRMVHRERGALISVAILFVDDVTRFFVKRQLHRKLHRVLLLPSSQFHEVLETSFRRALLRRRIVLWNQVRMLFHYWHVIHKPFAIIMYLVMVIHIGVALWTGYGWFTFGK